MPLALFNALSSKGSAVVNYVARADGAARHTWVCRADPVPLPSDPLPLRSRVRGP